jgi:uracil-DNA glycosylase
VLTVRHAEANSHQNKGWEPFTDAVIRSVNAKEDPVAFVLWGRPAQKKAVLITNPIHLILKAPHPSPLSAARGFFGSHPFSQINDFLEQTGRGPIDWRLPESVEA